VNLTKQQKSENSADFSTGSQLISTGSSEEKVREVTRCHAVCVCLFVRISVDTTVIIKNMSLPIQTTTNL